MIKSCFHFLGSAPFALFLIAAMASFVIAGTYLESATSSHAYAAHFTYSSSLFSALLGGFFINILFSALRRWPFQKRHIPFLTTHLGLLMVIGGTLVKNRYGVQGTMGIREGSSSDTLLLTDTKAILIETRDHAKKQFPLNLSWMGKHYFANSSDLELLEYHPHAIEKRESWMKGDRAVIWGLPPIPVNQEGIKTTLQGHSFKVSAIRSNNFEETVRQYYLKELQTDATIHWEDPLWLEIEKKRIDLAGPKSLINQNLHSYLGKGPSQIDLHNEFTLLIHCDREAKNRLVLIDPHGRIHVEPVPENAPLIAYDRGFGGYAVQARLPLFRHSREMIEREQLDMLAKQLKEAPPQQLSPPLYLLYQACQAAGTDFSSTCTAYLQDWNSSPTWLYPNRRFDKTFDHLSLSPQEKQSCLWIEALERALLPALQEGQDLTTILQKNRWPFLDKLPKNENEQQQLQALAQQLLLLELPPLILESQESRTSERLFSAYMRAYGLHLSNLPLPDIQPETIFLETPLTVSYKPEKPSLKWEENRPIVTVKVKYQGKSAAITLCYDPSAAALKWPLHEGALRLRFQPQTRSLPYHVRLRQARQISYPGTTQPYSYECDLLICPKDGSEAVEKTVSMNNVYEMQGYRFYLANIAPMEVGAVKQIQLVVNYDPAKYWLTYPGGIILALGISLFFFSIIRSRD